MSRKIKNASEMGRMGGKSRFEKIGSEGMAEMSRKGHQIRKKRDPEFYDRLWRSGYHVRQVKLQKHIKSQIKVTGNGVEKFTKLLTGE